MIQKKLPARVATIILGLVIASALSACGQGNDENGTAPDPQIIQTQDGKVAGLHQDGVRKFLGIPYAKPPVGKLRWKAPQPPQPWSGVLEAKTFAPFCAQTDQLETPSTSEDCLYLNVYAPNDDKTHPVMVWIYGGAFVSGASNLYNPIRFVNKGMVVVTFNYRLGMFGLLSLPALTAESPSDKDSGNYSLLDQQAVLHWVHNNIAQFGGNPNNVTLAGESAGGLSVLAQLVSPAVRGLFQKAIVESGSYSPKVQTLSQGEKAGMKFAAKLNCPQGRLKCMRAVPVQKILAKQPGFLGFLGPKANTKTLPHNVLKAFQTGDFDTRVPVLMGTNRSEGRMVTAMVFDLGSGPLTPAGYKGMELPAVLKNYPLSDFSGKAKADLASSAVSTDQIFACPGLQFLEAMSGHGVKTWAYEFNDPNTPPLLGLLLPTDKLTFSLGAAHATELPYLFDFTGILKLFPNLTPTAQQEKALSKMALNPAQQKLSDAMVDYWTSFAKTGNPNPSSGAIPSWPAFDPSGRQYMSLQRPQPTPISDFSSEHHCAYWNQ